MTVPKPLVDRDKLFQEADEQFASQQVLLGWLQSSIVTTSQQIANSRKVLSRPIYRGGDPADYGSGTGE